MRARSNRIRWALSGVALCAIASGPLYAQSASDIAPQESEEAESAPQSDLVITGTRLRGVAPVGSSLIGVDREAIGMSNALSTTQLIQEVPQVFNLGISEGSRGQSGGAFNTSFGSGLNIRGLGPFATLTLIDSHRSTPQGTTGLAVDPSIIPTLMIERIEIVADGSSAIYGSDAVAGVANIILRRKYDGVGVTGSYGTGDNYTESQFGLIAGKTWSTGQITMAFERQFRSRLSGRDRDFYRADLRDAGGGDYRSTLCSPGNILVGSGASAVSYAIPVGGVTSATAGQLIPNTRNHCDIQEDIDLLPETKRISAVMTFDQEITDWLRIKGDAFASKRKFDRRSDYASSTLTVPNTNAFFVAPPGTNPTSVRVEYFFDDDYPQGYTRGTSWVVQGTIGAEADLPHNWRVTGDLTIGRNRESVENAPGAVASALTAALRSNNPATAFDPFGLNRTSPETIKTILNSYTASGGPVDFRGYQLGLDGPLFDLGGGDVRLAVGYDGHTLRINPTNRSGTLENPLYVTKVRKRAVNSAYAELLVPIFGSANARPLLESLDINIAGRYDHYNDVGETWNPKIGVNWSPVKGMTIHSSYGTSFRAPTLGQLWGTGGNTTSLIVQAYYDPTCDCIIQGVALTGENPSIDPEEARTFSLGIDWRPDFAPRLSVSLNYFDIFYGNQIQAYISDLSVLSRESQFAGTGIITRNPDQDYVKALNASIEVPRVLPDPVVLFVDGRSLNAGETYTKGFDLQLGYSLPTDNLGRFNFSLSGTYFLKFDQAIANGGQLVSYLNTIFNPLRFKARGSVNWKIDKFDLGATAMYVNGYDNNTVTPVQKVKSYLTFDMRVGVDLGDVIGVKEARLSVEARNIFDRDPPFANIAQSRNGGGGFDPTSSNPVGRVVGVSLDTRF
jgi:iron complex outermembrane receptor protein